jgi:hypothetical protein
MTQCSLTDGYCFKWTPEDGDSTLHWNAANHLPHKCHNPEAEDHNSGIFITVKPNILHTNKVVQQQNISTYQLLINQTCLKFTNLYV